MSMFQTIQKIDRIHQLIRMEATGAPDEFAGKLHLKKRQLFNILAEFREQGADIQYSSFRSTYYYRNNFVIPYLTRNS
ncbi:MAG: DNA-binding protein [Dysgonamonadaceae bacterium]|nr:DNA-binding protein [Dysgonamonadaceae bacterium]